MIYLKLFLEFFKIGLFSIGGGLASLPFLTKLSEETNWYSIKDLTDMLAISESTPGPIGVNMSTYVGFHVGNVLGAIIATFALVLPSFIIIILVSKILDKFKENDYVKNSFLIIKSVVTGLIFVSFIKILNSSVLNFSTNYEYIKILLFLLIFLAIYKFKKHPIFYIVLGGFLGFVFKIN